MEESTSREKLIKRVRSALMNKSKDANREAVAVDYDTPVFHMSDEPDEIAFAQHFTESGGRFVFCLDENEFAENLKYVIQENQFGTCFCAEPGIQQLLSAHHIPFEPQSQAGMALPAAAIVSCEQAIASTGTLVLSANMHGAKMVVSHFTHILVLCNTRQVSPNHKEAMKRIKARNAGVLPGFALAPVDRSHGERVRTQMPSLQHRRPALF